MEYLKLIAINSLSFIIAIAVVLLFFGFMKKKKGGCGCNGGQKTPAVAGGAPTASMDEFGNLIF